MRTAIYFFYGLDVEIRPKSGVPHHPPELFIHLGGAIGILRFLEDRMKNNHDDQNVCVCAESESLYLLPHLGWMNSSGGWVRSPGGSISAESQHPAYKKLNGVPRRPANHDWEPFNLI